MAKRIALIIGINEYHDTGFNQLKYAETDARKVHEILTNPDICEFDNENVILLLGATKSSVEGNLEGILNEASKDDFVFIYFAGHGKLDRSGSLCLVARDTFSNRLLSTSINLDHIRRIIDQSDCKRIVFILDSCFSGAVGQSFRSGEVPSESIEQISGQGKVIISASQAYERARERDDLGHGIFTYNLVKCLEQGEADYDADGYITIDDVYKYLYENVSADSQGQQVPMKWGVDEKGDIILAKSIKILQEKKETAERLSKTANDLESSGKWEEALSLWNKILALDLDNYTDLVTNKISEIKHKISDIDKLFDYYHDKGLPVQIYNEAFENLKAPLEDLSEDDKSHRRLIDNLLNGDLSLSVFIDSWKRLDKKEQLDDIDPVIVNQDSKPDDVIEDDRPVYPYIYDDTNGGSQDIIDPKPTPIKPTITQKLGTGTKIGIGVAVLFLLIVVFAIVDSRRPAEPVDSNKNLDAEVAVLLPEINSFKISPTQINLGEKATLKWNTTNAADVQIAGIGKVAFSGDKTVQPKETTTYQLTAINEEGDKVESEALTLKVIEPKKVVDPVTPPIKISYFQAKPDTIVIGDKTALMWDVSNAKDVEIKPIGKVQTKGDTIVNPDKTTTYSLIATNNQGKTTKRNITVTVKNKSAPVSSATFVALPKIEYFKSNETKLEKGYPFILSWSTLNADEVEISGIGTVRGSGYKSLKASKTQTYTLTAKNKSGKNVTGKVTVSVLDEVNTGEELPKIQYEVQPALPEAVRRNIFKDQE